MTDKVHVAKVSDFSETYKKRVLVEGMPVLICRVEENFYAVYDNCTHERANLSAGTLKGCEIECPRHGAKFDVRTGAVTALPAAVSLQTFDVEVEGDDIYLNIKFDDRSK